MKQDSGIPIIQNEEGFEAAIVEALSEKGVVKIPGFATIEQLTALEAEFESIVKAGHPALRDLNFNEGSAIDFQRLLLEEGQFPHTRELFTAAWMQEVSERYWGDERILNDHIFVTRELPGTEHVAQDLHFDVQETLKFFLYLNDVTKENGAFSCVPGSVGYTKEQREILGDQISYENREVTRDHPYSETDVVSVEGKAGTLIVFTTEVWHRAGCVSEGERRVMRGHTRTCVLPSEKVEASARTQTGLKGLFKKLF